MIVLRQSSMIRQTQLDNFRTFRIWGSTFAILGIQSSPTLTKKGRETPTDHPAFPVFQNNFIIGE